MTEQNYSHREGVEKQRRKKGPVSVVFDFSWSEHFVILLHPFLQISTVHQAVSNCFWFCFVLFLNSVLVCDCRHVRNTILN